MGAPAVITVTDHTGATRRFYGHWASPQYQIPHLAEFIHQAWISSTRIRAFGPTVTTITPLDNGPFGATTFRVNFTAQATPGTYSYTVAARDLHDRERMRPVEDLTGRIQIYAGAARMCRQMAATTRRLAERGHPLPGPSAQAWQAEADRYDAWADKHTATDAQAPPRP